MILHCSHCKREIEVEEDVRDGQHFRCPYCNGKTTYRQPARVELPPHAERQRAPKSPEPAAAAEANASFHQPSPPPPETTGRLHVIRKNAPEPELNPADERKLRMAEGNVRFYEELRNSEKRRKSFQTLVSIISILSVLLVGTFVYVYIGHRQDEEARLRVELEHEREQRRLEREQAEREANEQLRLERERVANEARARREREEAEAQKRRLAAEKAASEANERERLRHDKEVRESRELYRAILSYCEDEDFRFIQSCPADERPGRADGLWCFLRPFEDADQTAFTVISCTNGFCEAYRLYENGERKSEEVDEFLKKVESREYLMVTKDAAYFSSKRQKPHVGQLPKDQTVDLSAELFGSLEPEIKRLGLDFDNINFEIVFVPSDSKKIIIADVIPFGGTYSLEKVREAVEEAFPPGVTRREGHAKRQKIKRTVVFWDGAHIKKGVDGITYVPKVAPASSHYGYDNGAVRVYGTGWGYDSYWRNQNKRFARAAHTREYWESLCEEAKRQDEAEKAAETEFVASQQKNRDQADEAARAKYKKRIDSILERGRLFWRVRLGSEAKGKVDK